MTNAFRAARLFAPALLAASALPAHAAEAPGAIIPVPLNPVVDAAHRTCSARTASGLGYTELRPGAGAKPTAADVVLVGYIGYLAADGTVFDQNPRAAFGVADVIPGFTEGLKLAQKGSVLRLCIPSAQGYGPSGSGPIPGNADLVFQVELLDFKSLDEVRAMQQAEAASHAAPAAEAPAPAGK